METLQLSESAIARIQALENAARTANDVIKKVANIAEEHDLAEISYKYVIKYGQYICYLTLGEETYASEPCRTEFEAKSAVSEKALKNTRYNFERVPFHKREFYERVANELSNFGDGIDSDPDLEFYSRFTADEDKLDDELEFFPPRCE